MHDFNWHPIIFPGFFIPGFPKLLRFQDHHEVIMKKFVPKIKKHLVSDTVLSICFYIVTLQTGGVGRPTKTKFWVRFTAFRHSRPMTQIAKKKSESLDLGTLPPQPEKWCRYIKKIILAYRLVFKVVPFVKMNTAMCFNSLYTKIYFFI